MASRIEDYALIGDCETAALVGRDGSIDWLCFPRFDSPACFAALLGGPEHGRWRLAPKGEVTATRRAYRDGTLVLETTFEADGGEVTVVDCMPVRTDVPDVVRLVIGRRGRVRMRSELVVRFDYGSVTPWVRKDEGGILAIAGPDMLHLRTPVELHGEDWKTVVEFDVAEGDRVPFVLTWHRSHQPVPPPIDAEKAIEATEAWWREWAGRCKYEGEWREAVVRSLVTLKALTYAPTGGMVAAATTSLPEHIGGHRNWDYRYCWLRDSTFTLAALLQSGYVEEARAWRRWLLRAVAGRGSELQIMYGVAGERRLTELELPWLPGYEGSRPVRIGNGAAGQVQLDVFGELMDTFYLARRYGLEADEDGWRIERELMRALEDIWRRPDHGIWERRGEPKHYTNSKMMAWVAFDRAVRTVENFGLEGPVERWRATRDELHAEVCERGFDRAEQAFTWEYGGHELDSSLLMMPLVGFLPASDPRVVGTVAAIERRLMRGGFVQRYERSMGKDGGPIFDGAFPLCTTWLADVYALMGREEDARRVLERLLSIRNDVGLLAEEYDPEAGRQLGNFPQAFSHLGLIDTARNLSEREKPAEVRREA